MEWVDAHLFVLVLELPSVVKHDNPFGTRDAKHLHLVMLVFVAMDILVVVDMESLYNAVLYSAAV